MHRRSDLTRARFPSSAAALTALLVALVGVAAPAQTEGDGKTIAVCLSNSLERAVSYEYRWGTGSWSWDLLEPGEEVEHILELEPRDPRVPWLQIRYQRAFGPGDVRTVARATSASDALDDLACQDLFAEPTPEELAAQEAENRQSARDRWELAAAASDREIGSGIDLFFEVPRDSTSLVRVWKRGETRPVVLGRISELREGPRKLPVALWGEGRYLVEILDDVELELVDSFVLDARERAEVTRLSPLLATP